MRLIVYRMETEDQDFGAGSGSSNESLLLAGNATSNVNYNNFGGFGGVRHGFNDPSRLDRPSYRQPQVSSSPSQGRFGANRAISPIIRNFSIAGYQLPTRTSPLRNDENGGLRSCVDIIVEQGPDCEMTTPDQSRNPSSAGQQPINPNICVCSQEPHPHQSLNSNENHTSNLPVDPYPASTPFVQLPSVSYLLDRPSPVQTIRDRDATTTPNHLPGSNSENHEIQNQHTPNPFGPPGSPVPLSSVSSNTIETPFSIQEQQYFLLNTVYNTCLNASNRYIRSLRLVSRRIHQSIRRPTQQGRHYPYPLLEVPLRTLHSRRGYTTAGRETTLMDNISVICTHIWRKARNDGMAPHRAEADAVRVMRDLYAWGEIVVMGLEADGRYTEDDSTESVLSSLGNNTEGIRIGEAAKRFCEWLKNGRASMTCEDVVLELRELFEMGGGYAAGAEDGSEDGIRIR